MMCARLAQLDREVERVEAAGIDALHMDVMDGHFVPNLGFSADAVRAIRPLTRLPIHVHLMVAEPASHIDAFADAGADVVFFHLEATDDPIGLVKRIERAGATPGVAISPRTPLPDVPELFRLPHVIAMTVEPGFAGQPWVATSPQRIAAIRERATDDTRIHADGAVSVRTVPPMWEAGADAFVGGTSGLFTSKDADLAAVLRQLRMAIPGIPAGAGGGQT
jgi:ribulose-phosphate 3-epimerase